MRTLCVVSALVVALSVVGCSNPEKALVGKWKVNLKQSTSGKKSDLDGFSKGFIDAMQLELKDDKTFKLNVFVTIDGKWSLSGDTLTLKPEKVMGIDLSDKKAMQSNGITVKAGSNGNPSDPITFKVGSGGKTLKPLDAKPGTPDMEFVKE